MAEIIELLLALAQNISLFVLMTVAFSAAQRRFRDESPLFAQLTAGFMFGIAGVVGIASPYHLADGVLIDGRNVVIAVGTVIGGPLAGAICTALTALYRWHVGGTGVVAASLTMLLTFCISMGFRQYWRSTGRTVTAARLGILGLCVAVVNLGRYAVLSGAADVTQVLETVALPILVLTPAGTYLAGAAALWSRQKEQLQEQLAASNRSLERAHSDAVAARTDAERANLEKSRFLASMSHELRTPLNAIIGFSDIIRKEMFGTIAPARYGDYVGLIHDSGQHLLSLINDVLDISKIEAGGMAISVDALSAEDVCSRAVEIVRVLAASRDVRLTSTVDPRLSVLHGDDRALQQILLNLLSNAIKFTDAGGSVHIGISGDESGGTIRVVDSGIGMTETEMTRALEPYGQVDSRHTRRQAGTGLGLPLAKRLAELHGGNLALASERGVGTSVSVLLPWHAGKPLPDGIRTAATAK